MKEDFYSALYNELYHKGYVSGTFDSGGVVLASMISDFVQVGGQVKPKLLDVGCSFGGPLAIAESMGFEAYGIDVSEIAIEECAKRHSLLKCCVASSCSIPFDDEFFDAILCTDMMEHLKEEDVQKSILEMCRVMKAGGIVLMRIAKIKEYTNSVEQFDMRHHGVDDLHITLFSSERWISEFERSGFKTIKVIRDISNFIDIALQKSFGQ